MHVPDGFLDAPTSLATAAVAAAAVAFALRGARRELDDRAAPLAGLVATFVFAAQMVNFPVGAGTSGRPDEVARGPRPCASPSSCSCRGCSSPTAGSARWARMSP